MVRRAGALIAGLLAAGAGSLAGEAPQRIASINMCTDQFLVDLVPRARIVGLSPYARDALRSWVAARADGLPILSGTAEEILILKPDLVLAGRYMNRATRDFITGRAIPLAEFDAVRSIGETRDQMLEFGRLTGTQTAAAARIAALDAALARLAAVAAQRPLRILPLARRGWVAGKASLMGDLLAKAGLANAAGELHDGEGGFVSLEGIVRLRPDALLVARDDLGAEDQGSAMLAHPAIATLFPPERRLYLSEKLTVCGGPMLAEAIDALAGQIEHLQPRGPDPPGLTPPRP